MKSIKLNPDDRINWRTNLKEEDLHTMLDEVLNDMSKVVAELRENMLVEDIINIYNGMYETYDGYINSVVRFNEISEHQNKSIINDYTFRYTPRKNALTQRIFNYIKELKESER